MTADKLTVVSIQTSLVWHDAAANRHQLGSQLDAVDSQADLYVLPEMFNTGFTQYPDQVAEPENGETVQWMAATARRLGGAICGSIPVRTSDNRFFNRFVLAAPDGDMLWYDKRHRFGLGGETRQYSAGPVRKVFQYRGWRILPQVCYDLRFPVFSRNTDDYDLAIYVANWPAPRRNAWSQLLIARAVENQCYVVGVNRIGSDANDIEYRGDSVVVDYQGHCVCASGQSQGYTRAELNRGAMLEFREKFPFLLDRDSFTLADSE